MGKGRELTIKEKLEIISHYEVKFDLNNPYESTDEEFLDMYSSKHQEIDVDEVIVDVVEEVVGLSVVERSL